MEATVVTPPSQGIGGFVRLPGFDLTPEQVMAEAESHGPFVARVCLFSGGGDSTACLYWALANDHADEAAFIDTGTALPGVRDFVGNFCAAREIPLLVYEAHDAYQAMVRAEGFPGPAAHRFAYVRLKERQIDALIRDHKVNRRDRIMLLTGVRRAESVRRMGTTQAVRRDGSQVWVAPLIDWTEADMRAYRKEHRLPQSEVAALIHRSGECNCGSFATEGEREELRSLWPEWFASTIAPLELATGARWGERWRGKQKVPDEAGMLCGGCQLRLETA
jgi:3'-phosphoadenosine 5'-phosphosulfate sulfotransferase (PAPS reductase)/FAD synthetase